MAENTDNYGANLLDQMSRYSIMERIGTGGMARVYRAKDETLERDVAVKILHDHLADDDMFRQRFEREAKFIANLNHPNIVQVYDYATIEQEDKHFCYMVMTYLPGKTLKAVMDENVENQRLMPHAEVLQIIRDIAEALHYAHQIGMVHRDVKPANILFNERGQAILTDFGIARLAEGSKLTQDNVAVGTPAYMAPEQASGDPVDARTDIYALGVILYELLAGTPPFGEDGSISILLRHLNEPPPAISQHNHIKNTNLDNIIFQALAKIPDERYQTAVDLAEDLERVLTGQPPQAASTQSSPPRKRITGSLNPTHAQSNSPRTTSPLGILVAGLSLIVIVLSAAFFVSQGGDPAVPTINPPIVPTERPTLDPNDFRNFGGIDSMTGDDPDTSTGSVSSMTTQLNESFISDFNPEDPLLTGMYWSLEETTTDENPGVITRSIDSDNRYRITNTIPNKVATSTLSDYIYDQSLTITSTITLGETSPRNTGFGIIFHYVNESNYGVFAIDGAGRYSIWFLTNGRWRELRNANEDWTFSPQINPRSESNQLRLEIDGVQLTGYVNDVELVTLTDDTLTEGGVGVYLANPDPNPNDSEVEPTIFVDQFSVTVADSSPDSMTATETPN